MTKKLEIRYHIIFWLVFIGLDQLFGNVLSGKQNMNILWSVLQNTGFVVLNMLVFYINYLWICPRTIPQKKWKWFALGQIGFLFLFPALRYPYEEIIIFHITGMHNYFGDIDAPYYLYDNSPYVITIVLISLVAYFVKYLFETIQQVNKLQLEKKQAELLVLKSQLSPHFLFNTLNSFYSDLYDAEPKVASDIMKLSEMLRYVTYENENNTVLLKDETEFLENYIALFNRRYDGTIPVVFKHATKESHTRIPALLLIHFVENAFKHGVIDDKNCPLVFDLEVNNNRLLFTATNHIRRSVHYDEPGIGYKNIRQRLDIMFPGSHTLDVREQENMYIASLSIPLLS